MGERRVGRESGRGVWERRVGVACESGVWEWSDGGVGGRSDVSELRDCVLYPSGACD